MFKNCTCCLLVLLLATTLVAQDADTLAPAPNKLLKEGEGENKEG